MNQTSRVSNHRSMRWSDQGLTAIKTQVNGRILAINSPNCLGKQAGAGILVTGRCRIPLTSILVFCCTKGVVQG